MPSEINVKTPTRDQLSKIFPNHEMLVYIENLFRTVGNLIPNDLDEIYLTLNKIATDVVSTKLNYNIAPGQAYSVMADASVGDITITMPSAASSENVVIGVTKVDSSDNKVIIAAQNGELVIGEQTQELVAQYEVLNFVSDSETWQLVN